MDLRELERASIRKFVEEAARDGFLSGRVLDYGCGKQPYRDIVESARGDYCGYDRSDYPANVSGKDLGDDLMWDANAWDAILCTQVLQYVPLDEVEGFLAGNLHDRLFKGGHLILTYPTNWPEVEPDDLHRFTKAGMERLLTEAGFEIVLHEPRASFRSWVNEWITDEFVTGYGVICRA